ADNHAVVSTRTTKSHPRQSFHPAKSGATLAAKVRAAGLVASSWPREESMGAVIARWAFAAVYLVIAIIAVWGGGLAISPPPPEATQFTPTPLAPPVNPAMVMTAVFYFLTALAFLAAAAFSVMRVLKKDPMGLVVGLNAAFAAALFVIGVYLAWMGGT